MEEFMRMLVRKEAFEMLKIPLASLHLSSRTCLVSEQWQDGVSYFGAKLTGENHTTCGSTTNVSALEQFVKKKVHTSVQLLIFISYTNLEQFHKKYIDMLTAIDSLPPLSLLLHVCFPLPPSIHYITEIQS